MWGRAGGTLSESRQPLAVCSSKEQKPSDSIASEGSFFGAPLATANSRPYFFLATAFASRLFCRAAAFL